MQPVQTTTVTAQQQPTLVYQVPPNVYGTSVYPTFKSKTATFLGIAHLGLGTGAVAFQIAAICVHASVAEVGTGFWTSILFYLSGAFCLAAASKNSTGLIVTTMVLCILSALSATTLLSIAAIGLAVDNDCYLDYWEYYCDPAKPAMNGILVTIGCLEIIVAIWNSVICCQAVCCGNRQQVAVQMYSGATHVVGHQVMQTGPQQPLYYTTSAALPQGASMTPMPNQYIMTPVPNQQLVTPVPSYQYPSYPQMEVGQGMAAQVPQVPQVPQAPPSYTAGTASGPEPNKNPSERF